MTSKCEGRRWKYCPIWVWLNSSKGFRQSNRFKKQAVLSMYNSLCNEISIKWSVRFLLHRQAGIRRPVLTEDIYCSIKVIRGTLKRNKINIQIGRNNYKIRTRRDDGWWVMFYRKDRFYSDSIVHPQPRLYVTLYPSWVSVPFVRRKRVREPELKNLNGWLREAQMAMGPK